MRKALIPITAALVVAISACGGGGGVTPQRAVPDDRPRIDGALVLDVPLEESSAEVREVWEESQRLLADPGPALPQQLGLEDYMGWMRVRWAPWLEGRVAALGALRDHFAALSGVGDRERIFSAVVAAELYQDLARRIEGLPVPMELREERDLAASFAESLRQQAAPAWARTRESLSRCIDWAPAAPAELTSWGDRCTRRLAELPDIEAPPPAPPEIAWPIECRTQPEGQRPGVPAESPTGHRPIALLPSPGGPLTAAERQRLVEAVHAHLRRTRRDLRLLPLREVRRAQQAASGIGQPAATRCARARSVVALLRARHADALPVPVTTFCFSEGGAQHCELHVNLGVDEDGGRMLLAAELDEPSVEVAKWIAAVADLAPPTGRGALVGVLGNASGRVGAVQIRGVTPYGAWGEVDAGSILEGSRQALAACRDVSAPPPADVRVVLEVAPDGGVSGVDVGGEIVGAGARACVSQILEDLSLPPGEGERRVTFDLAFYPEAPVALPYRALERRLHHDALRVPDALRDRFLRDAVARCFAGTPVSREAVSSYAANITVDGTGAVTNVDLTAGTLPGGVDEDVSACVEGALRTARFACTPDGNDAQVEATFCVGGR